LAAYFKVFNGTFFDSETVSATDGKSSKKRVAQGNVLIDLERFFEGLVLF
jgi:hypothetical protein